jgi:hypothetical protein
MGKELIANVPSRKAALAAAIEAPHARPASITPLVRGAVDAVYASDELFQEFMHYFDDRENSVTGSKRVDLYYAAAMLPRIPCNASMELKKLIENGDIKLIDIAKRIVPELRKRNMDIKGNVCLGLLTAQ